MPLAIFGIENTALNLVVTILILTLVAVWLALIVFTFTDARRRISDPFLVGCATAASLFPFIGTMVYSILRPPEFLEDIRERETEIRESEVRLRHLEYNSCPKCSSPVESDFLRCPSCRTRLKEPCSSCTRPVGLDWKVCPHCETTLIAPRRARSASRRGGQKAPRGESGRGGDRSSSGESRSAGKSRTADQPRSTGRSRAAEKSRDTGKSSDTGQSRDTGKSRSSTKSRASATVASRTEVEPDLKESRTDTPGSGSSGAARSGDGRESARTPRAGRRRVVVESDEADSGEPINRESRDS